MTNSAALLADPEHDRLDDIVNVERLGLDEHAASWRSLGEQCAAALSNDGLVRLPGFVRGSAVASIADEVDRLRSFVPVRHDERSVYAGQADPAGHPALSASSKWFAGHVTRDMIPPQSPAHRLYVSKLFKAFIASVVGADRLFEYADPLAGLVVTVLPPGGCYGWHYDTNEYVVTLAICDAERGGRFEYCRDLRRPGDENLDGLAAVMTGDDPTSVRSDSSAPADLQIFRGRYSLHRVTEVEGCRDRLTLVLSYADRPGVIGPVERTRRVYGRVTEAHLVAAGTGSGADGLIL